MPPPVAPLPAVSGNSSTNSQLANQSLSSPNPFGGTPPANPNSIGDILPPTNVGFHAPPSTAVPLVDFSQYQNNPTGAANAFGQGQAALSNAQNAARADIFGQYSQAVQGFGSTANNYNKLASAYGVPAYQQTMNNLQYAISHLKDDVHARTMGYNVNAPQADELYNKELQPLAQNLSDVGREYNTATSNIDKLLQYQQQDQATQLKPLEAYISSLDTSFANQNTAYGNTANAGLKSVQDTITNQLEQNKFAQNVQQFGMTYALEQQKFDAATKQFAQTYGLDQLKNQEAVDQFAKTYGLDQQKFRESARQFDITQSNEAARFAQTQAQAGTIEQLKLQQAAAIQQQNQALSYAQLQQKQIDDAAKNALYQAQIDKLQAQTGAIGTTGNVADYLGAPSAPPPSPASTNFSSGLGNFAAGAF